MLYLTVNRASKPPLYRQIAEQIKTQISNGRLPANSRLPTVRGLARSLEVALNIIATTNMCSSRPTRKSKVVFKSYRQIAS